MAGASLLERLKAGKKNRKTLKFPGTTEDVLVRVLSEDEMQDAHFAAERHFQGNKIEVSMATADAYEAEKTVQMLFRALRDPADETKAIAMTVNEFRALLERSEKDILVEEYSMLEQECSPRLSEMSDKDIDEFIEEVKKRPEAILGSVSNIVIARKLIAVLVSRLLNLQRASGSISS